ncbi:hypothetical protein [Leucobacter komagatae]|uniref:Uncharacterized protein n=1 Tax=Leucobacter komagatae TaxID=55969 RepID=A0A0D0IS59_9MICO|nr:hypothetical protein [Leucobacter komagatae]KIP52338.1 hypothetical protein SD72_09830 [Leucobacter komagatae]
MAEETKKAMPDHNSDPARTPGDGWVGEGGASHLGPATHIASGRDEEEDSAESEDGSSEGTDGEDAAERSGTE